jgi:hypothetical protein
MDELGIYDYSGYYAQFGADPTLVNAYYGLVAPGIATAWSTGGSVYDGYAQINDIIGAVTGFEPWPFF